MSFLAIESLSELVALAISAVGTFAFTTVGAITEQAAIENLLTGHLVLGAWEAGMGALALIIGVWILGVGKLLPRLRQLRRSA